MRISVLHACCVTIMFVCLLCQTGKADEEEKFETTTKKPAEEKKRILPKDPLYITDMDLERLYDEWEEADDEKLPPDELPPHKRPPPEVEMPDMEDRDALFKDPHKLMMAAKKGKTVMAFATIANNPTKQETEMLTQRWQVGLVNNHMKCERFVIANDRAIFVFEDGSMAYEAKEFFLDQPELKEYSIDNQVWHGKAFPSEPAHSEL